MDRGPGERLLGEVQEPLLAVLDCLSPQSTRIRSYWRTLLKRYKTCGKYAGPLSAMTLGLQDRELILSDPAQYLENSQRQGRDLAGTGVPPECAAFAVSLYIESTIAALVSAQCKSLEWERVGALARLVSVYELFLLAGYSQHWLAERQSLEDKVTQAERRSQEFSVQLGEAYEKERRHLAQDLHDEIGHDLIVLKLYTEVIALDLKKGDISQLRGKLKESVTLIKHALKTVRHLTFDLGPAIWNEQGFVPAVRLYARQFAKRTGIRVRLDAARMKAKLPARCETALYKVLQGALANVVAHADAHNVKITLASSSASVSMKIQDDGRGFDVKRKLDVPRQSYGLRAMRERIELLGGAIHFVSRPSRRRSDFLGTTIEAQLPLQDPEMI